MLVDDLVTYAEENVTVDNTVGGVRLTVANVLAAPPVRRVELFIADGQIRITTNSGGAPTSTVGEILNPFDRYTLKNAAEALNFRAIRTTATNGTIRARYLR